ncbi:MAG: hypothetical protein L6R30_26570, partial [Thermoanaerobaculia bacterium]|nr:hypothetical protein [Thermoanaerobaculia bacterium]
MNPIVMLYGPMLFVVPFVIGELQRAEEFGIVGVEPLGETLRQDKQAQEWSRDIDELEPFGVVAGDRHESVGLVEIQPEA